MAFNVLVLHLESAGPRPFAVGAVSPSYGDIFYGNCITNAILPVVLPEKEVAVLLSKLAAAPGARLAIDLDAQQVKAPDGAIHSFDIDPFRKHCLLNGIDEIGFTLQYRDQIARHAEESRNATPWM